jgi:hypothetical protein
MRGRPAALLDARALAVHAKPRVTDIVLRRNRGVTVCRGVASRDASVAFVARWIANGFVGVQPEAPMTRWVLHR